MPCGYGFNTADFYAGCSKHHELKDAAHTHDAWVYRCDAWGEQTKGHVGLGYPCYATKVTQDWDEVLSFCNEFKLRPYVSVTASRSAFVKTPEYSTAISQYQEVFVACVGCDVHTKEPKRPCDGCF